MNFDELVKFFVDNWQYISIALVGLFNLVFLILKKPYKVYGYYLDFLNWVTEAEKEFGSGHGEEKFEYVYKKYIAKYSDTDHLAARSLVAAAVDRILCTPQKKGVKNGKRS